MLKMWYWVTETVTQPWGIITHVALFGWFCGVYDFVCAKRWCCFILGAAIRQDRGLNRIKERVQEPRPFVIWLERTQQVPVAQFYELKRKERAKLVHEQLAEQQTIPGFLRKHWQKRPVLPFRPAIPCLPPVGRYWGRAVVAAPALGNYRFAVGLGYCGHGQSSGVGHALAAGSYRGDQPFMAAGYRSDRSRSVLRPVNPAC